jgi:allophanate hydrolase subunit 1
MGTATMVMGLGGDYEATRAVALRTRIARIAGVNFVEFNYTSNRVTVRYDPDQLSQKELENIVTREKRHQARSVTKLQNSSEVG